METPNLTTPKAPSTAQTAQRAAKHPERTQARPTFSPAVDIYENQDELLLVADVPGVKLEDVAIEFERNQLTLTARRQLPELKGLREGDFPVFDYVRSFTVPRGIDAEKIHAELSNGVLSVHLPRSAAAKPRKIDVRNG
jgi:HSP20 family molecular chaperone IbpA